MNRNEAALLAQALAYGSIGWKIFPCQHYGKRQKQPITANGFHDATDDAEQIKKWWAQSPKAWIGIRTGKDSGFWVVDVDMKNGKDGVQSLIDHFKEEWRIENDTLVQKTITGGFHLCYKWDEQNPVHNGQNLLPGVDVRGEGGYIIGAPSGCMKDDGWEAYRWKGDDLKLTTAPDWALSLTQMKSTSQRKGEGNGRNFNLEQAFGGLPEGQRDEDIRELAKLCKWQDISESTARVIVSVVAERCVPAFDTDVAIEKVTRVYGDARTRIKGGDSINIDRKKRKLELQQKLAR